MFALLQDTQRLRRHWCILSSMSGNSVNVSVWISVVCLVDFLKRNNYYIFPWIFNYCEWLWIFKKIFEAYTNVILPSSVFLTIWKWAQLNDQQIKHYSPKHCLHSYFSHSDDLPIKDRTHGNSNSLLSAFKNILDSVNDPRSRAHLDDSDTMVWMHIQSSTLDIFHIKIMWRIVVYWLFRALKLAS